MAGVPRGSVNGSVHSTNVTQHWSQNWISQTAVGLGRAFVGGYVKSTRMTCDAPMVDRTICSRAV